VEIDEYMLLMKLAVHRPRSGSASQFFARLPAFAARSDGPPIISPAGIFFVTLSGGLFPCAGE
jgi:hypothetical protein